MTDTLPPAVDPCFAGTVERLRAALYRYARVLGASPADADDLVQEAVLVALRRPGFAAESDAGVFTFLRTTVRHLWLRSRRRRGDPLQSTPAMTPVAIAEADQVWDGHCGGGDGTGDDYVEALRACVATLPPRSRDLLRATYAEGNGRAAAAARLGIGTHGVKSALRRLRSFLHACIRTRLAKETER